MNRRQFLLGTGGLTLTAGCLGPAGDGTTGSPRPTTADDTGDSPAETSQTADGLGVTVDTLDAPGSETGTQRLPVPGTVTLLDLFATWCLPCKAQMRSLRPVHDDYSADVAFVSVTNEQLGGGLTREDVADWWERHDGNWTLGHDPVSVVHRQVGASGLPYLVLTDADGKIVWNHAGVASERRLRAEIDTVLAGDG
jgi:thiol-disulfide isomerase/thioredoxin